MKRGDGKPGTERAGLIIESAESLNNTVWGNPRYRLYLVPADGDGLGFSAITSSDMSEAWDVQNHLANHRHPATVLTVRFTKAGRVDQLIPEVEDLWTLTASSAG